MNENHSFDDLAEKQKQFILAIAPRAPEDWVELFVSLEADGERGREVTDWVFFAVCKDDSGFVLENLYLEVEDQRLLLELRELYGELKERWSTVDVRLLSNGRYDFEFDYGPPKVLRGDPDAVHRFDNYLEGYEERHRIDLESMD